MSNRHPANRNPLPLEVALIALHLATSALDELANDVQPGQCTCKEEINCDHNCAACELELLVEEAKGQHYALDLFSSILESHEVGTAPNRRRLCQYLEKNRSVLADSEQLASMLLTMVGADDDEDDEEEDVQPELTVNMQ
jgi:hypothetical protein